MSRLALSCRSLLFLCCSYLTFCRTRQGDIGGVRLQRGRFSAGVLVLHGRKWPPFGRCAPLSPPGTARIDAGVFPARLQQFCTTPWLSCVGRAGVQRLRGFAEAQSFSSISYKTFFILCCGRFCGKIADTRRLRAARQAERRLISWTP